jgi:hypothetical protein
MGVRACSDVDAGRPDARGAGIVSVRLRTREGMGFVNFSGYPGLSASRGLHEDFVKTLLRIHENYLSNGHMSLA